MSNRSVAAAVAVAAAMVWMVPLAGAGQAQGEWTAPRTADGQPDLQGVWDFRTITPMERPSELAGKEVLTDEEAAEVAQEILDRRDHDRPPREGSAGTYNQFWWDYGTKLTDDNRTSLIVDPRDGRVPPRTPDAQERAEARGASRRDHPADSWEDRSVAERCILGFNSGPPMRPSAYNNNVQVFQAPGFVVILNEMVHDARIVPLDGRPHLAQHIGQWHGDSRGYWEGDTLVVDTMNFTHKTSFRGSTENLHLVERFTRVDADTLLYEFTIDDPTTFTRPWTAAVPMTKNLVPMYEYACHEGNYGMEGILAGHRADELAAAVAKTGSK